MEIYQWLLRHKNFIVKKRGYFVYARVNKDKGFEGGNLNFTIDIEHYDGDDSWIEKVLMDARRCLDGNMPTSDPECRYCSYRERVSVIGK